MCVCTAILLAVPFGSLSDKWGRKPVGMLAVVGVFLVTVSYEVVCTYSRRAEYHRRVLDFKILTCWAFQFTSLCQCGLIYGAQCGTSSVEGHLLVCP